MIKIRCGWSRRQPHGHRPPPPGLDLGRYRRRYRRRRRHNLTTKLAHAKTTRRAPASYRRSRPCCRACSGRRRSARVYRENLAAQGLTFGGIPSLIGPYNSFDARFQLTQTLFDLSTIRRYRAAGAGRDLAASQEALAREQVAAAAALSYIEAVRARKAVAAAQADADLADSLLSSPKISTGTAQPPGSTSSARRPGLSDSESLF